MTLLARCAGCNRKRRDTTSHGIRRYDNPLSYFSTNLLKVLGLRNKTESQIKEDEEEFYSTSNAGSFGADLEWTRPTVQLNARTSSWDKSKAGGGMLAHIWSARWGEPRW